MKAEEITANKVVEKILKRGVKYFDVDTLSPEKKDVYCQDLKKILRSTAFVNEVNHMIADWTYEIAHSAPDFETVIALRYSINGLEVLMERLGSVGTDKLEQTNEEPHAGI